MESERTEPTPQPIFEFEQSDGTISRVDFSEPGEFGDFACAHYPQGGERQYIHAYHTDTAGIFEYFLSAMATDPNAEQRFEQLIDALGAYEQAGMVATSTSESSYQRYQLDQIRDQVERHYHIDSYSGGDVTIRSDSDHTYATLSMHEHNRSVEVPHQQAWQFVAGIIWRSYGEPGNNYSLDSRHSTDTLKAALEAAAEGLSERSKS